MPQVLTARSAVLSCDCVRMVGGASTSTGRPAAVRSAMLGLRFRRGSSTTTQHQNLLVSNSVSKAVRGLYLLLIVLLIAASKFALLSPRRKAPSAHRRLPSMASGHQPHGSSFCPLQWPTSHRQDGVVTGGALTGAVNPNNLPPINSNEMG